MNTFAGAALVAAVLLLPALPASATPEPSTGPLCGMTLVDTPGTEGDLHEGPVHAGPIVVSDPDNVTALVTGTVRCTVQVNGPVHADPDSARVTGQPGTGTVSLDPTFAFAGIQPGDNVYLCTQVDIVGGPTYYWDATSGTWSFNPFTSSCVLAVSTSSPSTYTV